MKMRRFSRRDWETFAGVEELQDGSEPMINTTAEFYSESTGLGLAHYAVLIYERNSIQLLVYDKPDGLNDDPTIWRRDATRLLAADLAFLGLLPKLLSHVLVVGLGFERIN